MIYFSRYNTDTLAYKLLSGKLRENRKHSEQLNKYVAGLIDTDGCISLFFYKTRTTNKSRVSVVLDITQAAVNDPDFECLRALQKFYNLGSVSFSIPEDENKSSCCHWTLRDKDSKTLFNRVGKHMRLKATHFDNMIWVSDEHRDVDDIPDSIIEELKEFKECSRRNTRYLKMPKHLSWSYVAGVIAGDGNFKFYYRDGNLFPDARVKITQHKDSRFFLELFKRDFKGSLYDVRSWTDWERNLGLRDSSFAVPFLKNIRKYIVHERKCHIINNILDAHETHRQQRLNRENSKE